MYQPKKGESAADLSQQAVADNAFIQNTQFRTSIPLQPFREYIGPSSVGILCGTAAICQGRAECHRAWR
jgi:hypothetical protein